MCFYPSRSFRVIIAAYINNGKYYAAITAANDKKNK